MADDNKQVVQQLIKTCLDSKVLLFGQFTLKSGRTSPYFFNAGLLYSSSQLSALASALAALIHSAGLEFDVIFGPAYKGIALAAITCVELSNKYGLHNVGFAYNRKEAKLHGEGGNLVGCPLKGKRVLILDDVITAGTAIRESIEILQREGATLVGIIESLDRQEKGKDKPVSAVQEIESETGVKVYAAMTLDNIMAYLEHDSSYATQLQQMKEYRKQYGVV